MGIIGAIGGIRHSTVDAMENGHYGFIRRRDRPLIPALNVSVDAEPADPEPLAI